MADPTATPTAAPPEPPSLADLAIEQEQAVPPTETDEADSGAPEAEAPEGDGDAELDAAVSEYIKEHPEALPEDVRDKLQDTELQRAKLYGEQWQTGLAQAMPQALQAAQHYAPVNQAMMLENDIKGLFDVIEGNAKKAREDFEFEFKAPDARAVAGAIAQRYLEPAYQAARAVENIAAATGIAQAVAASPLFDYLTEQDYQTIRQAHDLAAGARERAVTTVIIQAALRAADPEAKRQAKADAETQAGTAEARAKLAVLLPRNGKKATGRGGIAARSDQELLADPTTPIEKLVEIRTRQRVAGG